MTRRALLMAGTAAILRAASAEDVWDVIGGMASALSRGDAAEFLGAFDTSMPGFERLRVNVGALLENFEVQAVIDQAGNTGDDRARVVEADWLLRFTQRSNAPSSSERRARVVCRLEKKGRKWKPVAFEPATLFDPPRL
jgi:hypothetical protein